MDSLQALELLCTEAKNRGATAFDAIVGESESMGLDLFEGKVKNTEISSSRGIGIRVFVDGRPGYAFTEKYSAEAIAQTAIDAIAHTKLTGELLVDIPEEQELPDIELNKFNEDLELVSLAQMKDLGLKLESIANKAHKKVENIPYLGVGKSSGITYLQNSKGARYSVRGNSIYAGLGVVGAEGEQKKMGVYSNSSRDFTSFDPSYMAHTAVERAVELLGAHSIKSGQYPIVLSNRISPQLISMYGSSFYADVIQKGQSKLADKLNTKIATEAFNLISDPHLITCPGSRLFDGEGVLCHKMDVIKDGELKNFLYNLESAHKENKESNGHASRDYGGKVGTGFSNFIVPKGDKTLEQLMSTYGKCLYVTNLEGGSGCSAVSGEISIGAQGFWIEEGKKIHPVDGITISSNFFDLIQNIEGLSNSYSDAYSSVKVPDLLIKSMYVAG